MRYCILFVCLFYTYQVFNATYYVSLSGNNANTGLSTAAPWKTIQFALNQANAGDVINVMAGTYTGKLTWNHEGSGGSYITLQNYNEDIVILDGSTIGNSQPMMYIENKDYIKIDGLQFTNHNGNYQPVINIYGNCNHIEISNCTFYNTDCNESYAILCEGAGDDIRITGNDMHDLLGDNAVGILFVGANISVPFSNVLITDNHIQHIEPAPSEAIAVNGNIDGFEISNNLVEDVNNIGIVMIGGEDWVNTNDLVNYARNGVCKFNTVINANSIYGGGFAGGVYVDGGKDIVVENNTITGSDVGLEIGCENAGFIAENITVRNNLIYKNEKSGLGFGGYDYPATGKVQNCTFTGNTVYDNDLLNTGFGQLWIQYALNCVVENNIFYTSTNAWLVNAETIDETFNVDLNYNLYYYPGGAINTKFFYDFNYIVGYSTFTALTGGDWASLFTDPQFEDILSPVPDFHILPASPCINAGNPAYTGADPDDIDMDFGSRVLGGRIDIGTDESDELPLSYSVIATPATCNGSCNGSLSIAGLYGCSPYTIEYKPPGMGWMPYTGTLTGLCAGTYKLRVTDDCAIVIMGNVNITQDPVLNLSVTSIINETSPGASNGKITVKATGGFGVKQYSIDEGVTWQTSKKFTGLTAGTYVIHTKDAHFCETFTEATVGVGMRMAAEEDMNIFPNPAHGIFNLHLEGAAENYRVEIMNELGAVVYSEGLMTGADGNIQLVHELPAGIYMVTAFSQDASATCKLVVY